MNAGMMLFWMPIQSLVMYAAFTKYAASFKPANIRANARHDQRMKRILRR